MINIIAAVAKNGIIGSNFSLPWDIPEDKRLFAKLTQNSVLIMGRNTYYEIGKALASRHIIVLSRSSKIDEDYVTSAQNLHQAIKNANILIDQSGYKDIFICGGAQVYKEALNIADKLFITWIDKEYNGDTYFPEIKPSNYKVVSSKKINTSIGIDLTFNIYQKL